MWLFGVGGRGLLLFLELPNGVADDDWEWNLLLGGGGGGRSCLGFPYALGGGGGNS